MADRPVAPKAEDPKEEQKKRAAINAAAAANPLNVGARAGPGQTGRGYNYSSYNPQTGELKGSSPTTGSYSYNPQTGPQGNIPNDAAQRLESVQVKNQIASANIDRDIAELERQKAESLADYQKRAASGRMSGGEMRQGNIAGKNIDAKIAELREQKQSLARTPESRSYSGVMATSGKIYESAAEAKRQGATVMKNRQGKDVKFEGDIRASAGYGQSNRGYSYLDTSDKEKVYGATPQGGEFVINKKTGVKEGNVPKEIAAAFPWTGQETGKIPVQADYTKNFVTGEYQKSDTGFPVVTNPNVITNRSGKGTPSDPFRANQPEENRLANFANPVWKVGDKTFQDKKEADLFIASQATWKVGNKTFATEEAANEWIARTVIVNGKSRTFETKERAAKFMAQYGGTQSSYLGFSPEGKAIQGPQNVKTESVDVPAGSLTYLYGQQPETQFNKIIGGGIKFLSDIQTGMRQGVKEKNILAIISEPIVNPLAEAGRSGLSTLSFVVNTQEQVIDPIILGKSQPKNAPIILGDDTASITQIPINAEKLNVLDPSTYGSSLQNPFEKEYQSKQAKYIEKFGVSSYIAGAGENIFTVFSGAQLAKTSVAGTGLIVKGITQKGVKALTPSLGRAAKSAAITNAPSSIFKGESKFASPSASWDVAEKITPAGLRKTNRPTAILPEGQRNPGRPVPNPFGKEREPIYTIRLRGQEAIRKGKKLVQDIPQAIDVIVPLEIIGLGKAVKADARIIAQKTKSGLRSSMEAVSEWNRSGRVETIPEGYTRRNTRLERMKNLMWPDEPILPPKKSTSPPPGYKAVLSARVIAQKTKSGIAKNLKTLNEADKNIGKKITNPILDIIRKDQRTPNRSINRINFGRKSQIPKIPDETPRIIIKASESSKINLFRAKEKLAEQKKSIKRSGEIMRNLFYPQEPKKETVPYFTQQGLKNLTREDNSTIITDFFKRQKAREKPPNLRAEFPVKAKRDYSITPKPHQDYLKEQTLAERLQGNVKRQIEKRRAGRIDLAERNLLPYVKYKPSSLMERIAGDVKPVQETKTEYMPRKRSTSKPGKNVFIEDRAKETQDFLDSMKGEKTVSREFKEEFRNNEVVFGLSEKYFAKPKVSKARTLNLREEFTIKPKRETPIEKLKSDEPKGIKEFVAQGEKRRVKVESMRSEKKLELPERKVSIFKVPYKETELDKMLAALGKKPKSYFKKSTYQTEKTPSQKDFEGEPLKKRWRDETRKDVGKGKQVTIMEEPKAKTNLDQPAPETKSDSITGSGKDKSNKNKIIIPPLPKEQKKKPYLQESSYISYEIPLNKNRPQITPRSMSGSTLNIGSRSMVSAKVNISQITPQKTGIRSDVKSGQKLYTPQKIKSFEITKTSEKLSEALKQPQKQKSRSKTRTPEINKPMAKQTPVFKTKQPAKFAFRTPEILIEPPKMLIPIPPPSINKPKKSGRKSGRKGLDFLGSSPTDSIVGLYSRRGSSDIILGDRASQKQLDKDRRTKSIGLGLGFSNRKKFKI